MGKNTYFSNRIYKHTLSKETNAAISHSLLLFNRGKHQAYAWKRYENQYDVKRYEESLHLAVKHNMYNNDYYANSAVQEANALLSSQKELQTLYISLMQNDIKSIKEKLKSERSRLTKLRNMKTSIIKGKPKCQGRMGYKQEGNLYTLQKKYISHLWFSLYDFEHLHLDKEIKFIKGKIGRIEHRLFRKEQQLLQTKKDTPSVVFGGKKLFHSQYTVKPYKENHSLWKQRFHQKRYSKMTISGRKDAKNGNFVFHYEPSTNELKMKEIKGTFLTIPSLVFPYGQGHVNEAIHNQVNEKDKKKNGKPIAWSVEDYGQYYIFKIMIDAPSNPHVNYYKGNGVIGVDLNVDHLAWSNINRYGQLLKSGTQYFSLHGKSGGQITKIIEAEAVCIVDLAVKENKPIVLEKLDTTKSKSGGRYRNKKQNRMMSLFAYRKLTDSICSRAKKMGVDVLFVNPAFTSQIGKMKYMKQKHISIHIAASYVIGRRGMGYKEKVPKGLTTYSKRKENEHHWKEWSNLHNQFNNLRSFLWYHAGKGTHLFTKEIVKYDLLQKEKDVLEKVVPKEWLEIV